MYDVKWPVSAEVNCEMFVEVDDLIAIINRQYAICKSYMENEDVIKNFEEAMKILSEKYCNVVSSNLFFDGKVLVNGTVCYNDSLLNPISKCYVKSIDALEGLNNAFNPDENEINSEDTILVFRALTYLNETFPDYIENTIIPGVTTDKPKQKIINNNKK